MSVFKVLSTIFLVQLLLVHSKAAVAEEPKKDPIILIHGSGDSKIYKKAEKTIEKLRENLKANGFKEEIFLVRYDWMNSMEKILEQIKPQIDRIIQSIPERKFTLIGHSLGHLIAVQAYMKLYTFENLPFYEYVGSIISVAGSARGISEDNIKAPLILELLRSKSDAVDLLVNGIEILNLEYERYRSELEAVKHCAVYSNKDQIVPGSESAQFKKSKMVNITDEISQPLLSKLTPLQRKLYIHYKVASSQAAAKAIMIKCLHSNTHS